MEWGCHGNIDLSTSYQLLSSVHQRLDFGLAGGGVGLGLFSTYRGVVRSYRASSLSEVSESSGVTPREVISL